MITGFHGHRHSRGHPLLGRGIGKVPLPVANDRLATWLHADTAATGEGTVTADGSGNVSEWRDPRGGFLVSQATAGQRPVSGDTTLNGKNVIRGRATGAALLSGAVSIDPTQKIRIFQVGVVSNIIDNIVDFTGTASSRLGFLNNTIIRITNVTGLQANTATYTPLTPVLMEFLHDNNLVGASQEFDKFEDGVSVTGFPRGVASNAFSTETLDTIYIFDDSSGGNELDENAYIAEQRVYVGDLTAQEITDIRAEMTGEWLFT